MKIGYAKEKPRLAIGPQIDALKNDGVKAIWRNDDLSRFIEAIRPGDEVMVQRVSLLGQKRKRLEANVREIFRLGGSITESETGRTSLDNTAKGWDAAMRDAFAELAGKRVFNPGQPGRLPKRALTEAERLKAEAIWFKAHDNNETRVHAVLKAIGEPFDYHFGYRLFGKPSAKP